MHHRKVTAAMLLFLAASASRAGAGPKRYVGAEVAPDQRTSINEIDHSSWDGLLKKYVDPRGGVNYGQWKANSSDVQLLNSYLDRLSTASLSIPSTRAAQLAYWINAYNAVTVAGILQEYPTSSIRNHTAKLVGYNIWHDLLLKVDGRQLSLDTMEHKVLRKMNEPRIHFAIVCASISCPRLRNEAYVHDKLDAQLTDNTKDFFANGRNFSYDPALRSFRLSAILDWFGSDFGSTQAAQLQAIAPYLPGPDSSKAAAQGQGRVSYLDYDWGLNEQGQL